jgi:hypothetical protein
MPDETPPPEAPPPLPHAGTEAEMLLGALDRNRATFAWKCGGLAAHDMRATLSPSTLTLAGLVKHLALVEDHYFTRQLLGRPYPAPWDAVDFDADPDWEWRTALDDSPDDLMGLWRASVERSRAAVAEAIAVDGLDVRVREAGGGEPYNLRRVLVDAIEEYARHTGHADLLRESVDGLTGESVPR